MRKIPQLTALFWLIKIVATTLGETAGDLFSITFNIGYLQSFIFLFLTFLILASFQIMAKNYNSPLYWSVIVATSTAGTTLADFINRTLKLGYFNGSVLLFSLLTIILVCWKVSEKSINIDQVDSKKSQFFYWTAILVSNTLGTALGDYLADDSGLGYLGGATLIAVLLFLVVLTNELTKFSKTALFWIAFVLTRPFGATFGDLLSKSKLDGGLEFGTEITSSILLLVLLFLLYYEVKSTKVAKKSKLQIL